VPGCAKPLGKRISGRCEDRRARQRLPRLEREQVRRAGPRANENQTIHSVSVTGNVILLMTRTLDIRVKDALQ